MKNTDTTMEEARLYLEQMHDNPTLSCQPTGYDQWDALTGGLVRGGLNLIAARPRMGQTALVMNLVERMSKQEPGSIMIFFRGKWEEEIFAQLLQIGTGVEAGKLLDGTMDWQQATELCSNFFRERKSKILCYPYTYYDMKEMAQHCTMVPDLRLVVVCDLEKCCDPVGDYDWNTANLPRKKPMDKVVVGLKELARSLDVPVVGTVYLPRDLDRRKDKHPRLKDLERMNVPVELVDQIAFLYSNNYYYFSPEEITEYIIAKSRYGTTGTLHFHRNWVTAVLTETQK